MTKKNKYVYQMKTLDTVHNINVHVHDEQIQVCRI